MRFRNDFHRQSNGKNQSIKHDDKAPECDDVILLQRLALHGSFSKISRVLQPMRRTAPRYEKHMGNTARKAYTDSKKIPARPPCSETQHSNAAIDREDPQ